MKIIYSGLQFYLFLISATALGSLVMYMFIKGHVKKMIDKSVQDAVVAVLETMVETVEADKETQKHTGSV